MRPQQPARSNWEVHKKMLKGIALLYRNIFCLPQHLKWVKINFVLLCTTLISALKDWVNQGDILASRRRFQVKTSHYVTTGSCVRATRCMAPHCMRFAAAVHTGALGSEVRRKFQPVSRLLTRPPRHVLRYWRNSFIEIVTQFSLASCWARNRAGMRFQLLILS
jgi:hypothetical protein